MPKKELDLSFLIQPTEEFELPSRGLHYEDSILKKGKVHCRPWVSTDEKLIDKAVDVYNNWKEGENATLLFTSSSLSAKRIVFLILLHQADIEPVSGRITPTFTL